MNNCEYSFEKFTHIEDLVHMLFTLLADSECCTHGSGRERSKVVSYSIVIHFPCVLGVPYSDESSAVARSIPAKLFGA
jgi:hypothetical protein